MKRIKNQLLFVFFIIGITGVLNAQFCEPISTKLLAATPSDNFGYSLAMEGTRLFVGARYANGAGTGSVQGVVDVYDLVGGVYQQSNTIVPSTTTGCTIGTFGSALAVDNNRIVVGANSSDENGIDNVGAAFVYDWVGGAWQETKILASDRAYIDFFGVSVAIDGDRIAVGTLFRDAFYIYDLIGGVWQETHIITGSDTVAGDRFGSSVAMDGNRIVVGAPHDGPLRGAVYVYDLIGSTWQETKLLASDIVSNNKLGYSVAVEGNRIVAGAKGVTQLGSAYVFDLVGGNWQQTKIIPSDLAPGDNFGHAVALEGNKIIVGANGENNATDTQNTYLYELIGGTWQETKLTATDAVVGDEPGFSVALSGDQVAIGAPFDDNTTGLYAGSVYLYSTAACQSNLYVSNPTIPDAIYQAQVGVNSDQTVPANGYVVFSAGQEIVLNAGFEVNLNAVFCAIIQGCTP